MGNVDAQLTAGRRDALAVQVIAKGSQKADVNAQQAQISSNILPYAAKAHRDRAGVGILRYQRCGSDTADVHVRTADDGRIAAAAENIAFPGNVALFHQVGNVYGHRGAGDSCLLGEAFLRDHGVGFDPLQDLPFPLCHTITA